jgi:hypothetical protein
LTDGKYLELIAKLEPKVTKIGNQYQGNKNDIIALQFLKIIKYLLDLNEIKGDEIEHSINTIIKEMFLACGKQQDAADFMRKIIENINYMTNTYDNNRNLIDTLFSFRVLEPTPQFTATILTLNIFPYSPKHLISNLLLTNNPFYTKIENMSKFFVIELNRSGESGKIMDIVEYDKILTIPKKLLNKQQEQRYELFAVCYHIGTSMKSGHYIAHGMLKRNEWYQFDDSETTKITPDEVKDAGDRTAYLLFYRKL